jgi:hypothetical protein
LHTENQLYNLHGSALKVCVVCGWVEGVESEFSDQLWLWPSQTINALNSRKYIPSVTPKGSVALRSGTKNDFYR